jgi:hypothetical protein
MNKECLQLATQRSEAVRIILERDISILMNLKPSKILSQEDNVNLLEYAKNQKAGIDIAEVNEIWKNWLLLYKKTFKKSEMIHDEYGTQELRELFEDNIKNLKNGASLPQKQQETTNM